MRLGRFRILCTREFQKNIADSSKKLIEDTIKRKGWESEFDMQRAVTRHRKTGSEILYYGLHHNATEIKSLEGVDIVWMEEAENTSQESFDMLIPTIRKPKSIIIITFNPDKKENPVYKDFVDCKPFEGLVRQKVNWYDNEFFPDVLKKEMERCRERDPEKYDWIWEGNCRTYSEAQVFKGKYSIKEFEASKDAIFMYGSDWGFSQDPTTLLRCYVEGHNLYIDYGVDAVGVEIDNTPRLFDNVPDARNWRIIADSARPETISYMKRQGFDIVGAKKGANSIEDGIEFLKSYDVIIHPRCKGVIEEFNLYSYKQDRTTSQILTKLEDKHNHYIDALRYAVEPLRRNQGEMSTPDFAVSF